MSKQELAQKILEKVQQAINNAAPTDDEEEYEGRSLDILYEGMESIKILCQEQLTDH